MCFSCKVLEFGKMIKHFVPFTATTLVYFYLWPALESSLWKILIKCLPIYSLALAVYLQLNKTSKYNFAKLITYGLLSSSVGDACLVWHDLFPLGMMAFAVAHCFYIKAFGFKPLKLSMGIVLYSLSGLILFRVLPNIQDEVIFYGVPIYSLFLVTMSWRALARAADGRDAWSWSKTTCAIGSVLFVISDTIICFHDLQKPIPFGRILIMTTYYAGQMGIAFSVSSDLYQDVSSDNKFK